MTVYVAMWTYNAQKISSIEQSQFIFREWIFLRSSKSEYDMIGMLCYRWSMFYSIASGSVIYIFVDELEVFYLKKFKDTFMCNNVCSWSSTCRCQACACFYFMFMILTLLITDIRLYDTCLYSIYFYYLNLIYYILLHIRLLRYIYATFI